MYKNILSRINQKDKCNVIVIDGVVGAGKTTLSNLLEERCGFKVYREPVVDNPILNKFYHNRERYSFPLQIFFLNKRFEHIKKAMENNDIIILDRSIYADIIFAKMLCDNNEMTKEEFDIYKELLCNMLEHIAKPKLMIYLDVTVDEAINRINKRGRDYEQITERAYWENLNKEYNEFFKAFETVNIAPVLKIDVTNKNYENNECDKKSMIDTILSKLNEA